MTTSRRSSGFRAELLRIMFKPTEKSREADIVVRGRFKKVYEFARRGMNLLRGGEEQWQESSRETVRHQARAKP